MASGVDLLEPGREAATIWVHSVAVISSTIRSSVSGTAAGGWGPVQGVTDVVTDEEGITVVTTDDVGVVIPEDILTNQVGVLSMASDRVWKRQQ